MKKMYVLLFVIVSFAFSAQAQFKKGDVLLGGSVGLYNQNRSANDPVSPKTSTAFNIAPSVGFFTSSNRLTGFSLLYTNEKYKSNSSEQTSNGLGAGIYKQYWNSLGKKFYFIIEGSLSGLYAKGNTKFTTGTNAGTTVSEQKVLSVSAGIAPGISYQISKRFTIDLIFTNFLSINDTYSKNKDSYPGIPVREYDNNRVGLNAGFTKFSTDNLLLGFRYIFN